MILDKSFCQWDPWFQMVSVSLGLHVKLLYHSNQQLVAKVISYFAANIGLKMLVSSTIIQTERQSEPIRFQSVFRLDTLYP